MKGKRPLATPAVMTPRSAIVATLVATPGRTRRRRWIPIFHYYIKRGHIKPQSFQFFAYLRRAIQERMSPRKLVKQERVKKSESKCNVAFTTLKSSTGHAWYFDSGCSRHMTNENNFLVDV